AQASRRNLDRCSNREGRATPDEGQELVSPRSGASRALPPRMRPHPAQLPLGARERLHAARAARAAARQGERPPGQARRAARARGAAHRGGRGPAGLRPARLIPGEAWTSFGKVLDVTGDPTCPVCRTADVVCGKWTLLLVRDLSEGRSRFCELERSLAGISPRTLSLRLRALEEEGIVDRHTYAEVPPRVEYQLTEKGRDLLPIIQSMREYGTRW